MTQIFLRVIIDFTVFFKDRVCRMKRKLSSIQIIALGFFIMILLGTGLLLLPVSTTRPISPGEAFFTATSSSCVTGLVVTDTAETFTFFGQFVLLILIQTGGLGFMTMAMLFLHLFRRKMRLREKEILTESLNSTRIRDVPALIRFILKGTFLIEVCGAALLSIRFIPLLGVPKGIWYSVFHAVSAFCNAGFDLMGTVSGPYSSLTLFADDWLFNLTVIGLIQLGGLGFLVWSDILENGIHPKHWNLHTKLVLFVNSLLVLGGTLLFFLLERSGSFSERLLHALFDSITPRTAGFNTVDTTGLSGGSKLLTIGLMFIGGSPGSTAGGIKTTTAAVMILFAFSQAKRARSVAVFGRSIRRDALEKATAVFFYNLTLAVAGAVIILLIQPLSLEDVLFETFSAIDTVGMTTGITRDLLPISRLLIALLMYLGRVGSTSFAIALVERGIRPVMDFPPEEIMVG